MAQAKMRWGDQIDDDDGTYVPPTQVIGPDANGITITIEFKKNDKGDVIKYTTKTETTTVVRKVYKSALERRQWPRFGKAASEQKTDSVTVQAVEDIPFERVWQRQTQDEKKAQDLKEALAQPDKAVASQSLKELLLRKRMERELLVARGLMQAPEKPPEEDAPATGSGPAAMPSRTGYVPPSMRARMAGGDPAGDAMRAQRRDENSVRVTNLSPDTREDDLRELFSRFGQITRVYVALDRERGISKGFAFVNFMRREDAARAIQKLNGYGYDNLILHVEWAQPREQR